MTRKCLHILLLATLLFLPGCVIDLDPLWGGMDMELTVRCDDTPLTKTPKDGEDDFNENLIKSVDFLFYLGDCEDVTFDRTADAVYHIRQVLDGTVNTEKTFNLVVKKNVVGQIFKEEYNFKATVYVLVNFEESFIRSDLLETSLNELAARKLTTLFPAEENDFKQPSFYMDGLGVLEYIENNNPSVAKTIEVTRFASKLTVMVHVDDEVLLHHEETIENGSTVIKPVEHWKPVLHTMRAYLVDGVKTIQLSHDGSTLPDASAKDPAPSQDPADPSYFSYKDSKSGIDASRPFVQNDNVTECLHRYTEDQLYSGGSTEKVYYECAPMYTYPRDWTDAQPNYEGLDYPGYRPNLPPEPPYLKIELDWERLEKVWDEATQTFVNTEYTYDLRKYYYKIPMPFPKNGDKYEFVRNNWYNIIIDIGILGSETVEGEVMMNPSSCYILDWQNKSQVINKQAVISRARYLSVDRNWVLNNKSDLSIHFLSSHNVAIIESSIKATRPYYGEDKTVNMLHDDLHAWVRGNEQDGYYLDYVRQSTDVGTRTDDDTYNPVNWLTPTATTVEFLHALQPDYTGHYDFDYSPYTIEFDIVHEDLLDKQESVTFNQYKRHIVITQYPAIYVEATHNHDIWIKENTDSENKKWGPYGYENIQGYDGVIDTQAPWSNMPWGYVFVNGQEMGNRHFIRRHDKETNTNEPYSHLQEADSKMEYKWQAVWYTGGSKDVYNIHVTVLPQNSGFIIGDPRTDDIDNLTDPATYPNLYHFITQNQNDAQLIGYSEREGFNSAKALYGNSPRTLMYYYPTENSSRTKSMLAPSYRISSKLGGTEFGNLTKPYAEYRCAAYQEDGFPAGRWRLPTKAEINFIASLSAKKAIEYIFGKRVNGVMNSAIYWSAHGPIEVNPTSGTVSDKVANDALLRCVYDSWYWDKVDEQNARSTNFQRPVEGDPRFDVKYFYWGDKER